MREVIAKADDRRQPILRYLIDNGRCTRTPENLGWRVWKRQIIHG